MTRLTIESALAKAEISADQGAALTHYAMQDGTPVFRPTPTPAQSPFDLACNLMLPWCNRVSGGGFNINGRFHALKANMPDQRYPLHGNAFQLPWQVASHDATSIELELISRGPGPYHYEAHVRYALDGTALIVDLGLWHWGEEPLPYGLGLHPWFEKDPDTTVQFHSDEVILTDDQCLPTSRVPISEVPDWQFGQSRVLPEHGIDNAFAGWDGRATLTWPSRGMVLEIATDPSQQCCHVFTPGKAATFFCFEPVSHLPDAHNWAGAAPQGLQTLAQGEGIELRTVFTPYQQS